MRKYEITAYVGLETHTKIIEANNIDEANRMALDYGHKCSKFGRDYLSKVTAKPIKQGKPQTKKSVSKKNNGRSSK